MNLYIVDYKPNGECVWIPLDELNNYIDPDNYPDKVSGRKGKVGDLRDERDRLCKAFKARIRELEETLREIHDWTCDELIRRMAREGVKNISPNL